MEMEISREAETAMKATLNGFKQLGAKPDREDLQNYCRMAAKDIIRVDGPKYPTDALLAFVENVWYNMDGVQAEMPKPKMDFEERMEWYDALWTTARPMAVEYINRLPVPPKLDGKAISILPDGRDFGLLHAFNINGRALDEELTEEQRQVVRKLEDAHFVRQEVFETTIKKTDERRGHNDYRVFYWEPTKPPAVQEAQQDEMADLYKEKELWKRPNGQKT